MKRTLSWRVKTGGGYFPWKVLSSGGSSLRKTKFKFKEQKKKCLFRPAERWALLNLGLWGLIVNLRKASTFLEGPIGSKIRGVMVPPERRGTKRKRSGGVSESDL